MNEMNRDNNIISCMADWCGQIRQAHERFGGSRTCFLNDTVYRNFLQESEGMKPVTSPAARFLPCGFILSQMSDKEPLFPCYNSVG